MDYFLFVNPDSTIQIIDLQTMFRPGCKSSEIRGYGVSIASRYASVCEYMARGIFPASDAVERVGIMLGQQIHGHLLRGEEVANIWGEVYTRLQTR